MNTVGDFVGPTVGGVRVGDFVGLVVVIVGEAEGDQEADSTVGAIEGERVCLVGEPLGFRDGAFVKYSVGGVGGVG